MPPDKHRPVILSAASTGEAGDKLNMERTLEAIDRVLGDISSVAIRVSCLFLILVFALTNVEILGRYLFGFSTLIAEEYVSYFLVWMTFLGYAATLRGGHFIRVQVILDRASPRLGDLLQGTAAVLSCGLCVVLAYSLAETVRMSWLFHSVSLQVSQTPLVIPQSIMPVAMAFLALVFLNEAVRHLKSALRPSRPNAQE